MVDFRKLFPALALIAILLCGAVGANAQNPLPFTCNFSTANNPLLRAEGITELVGDIVLRCTGGIPTAAGQPVPTVNFSIFLNTNITSRLITGNLTESLLLIDEPDAASVQNPCDGGTVCPIVGTGAIGVPNVRGGGVNYGEGDVANIYQAQYVAQGAQSYLSWTGVPIDPPGTIGERTLRFTNIRADASFLGVSSSLVQTNVIAFVVITSTQSITLTNPNQIVGTILPGIRTPEGVASTPGQGAASPFYLCRGNVPADDDDDEDGIFNLPSLRISVTEGFASAFKPRIAPPSALRNGNSTVGLTYSEGGDAYIATTPDLEDIGFDEVGQNIPGQFTFSESGFVLPDGVADDDTYGSIAGGNAAGLANTGTRLIIRFSNIPANVTVSAGALEAGTLETLPAGTSLTAPAGPASRLRLIEGANANGAGGSPADVERVDITNNSYLVYEVVGADSSQTETFNIPIYVTVPANTAGLTPANALPTATIALAPISDVRQPSRTAPVPRFVNTTQTVSPLFQILPCRTNILFPFVTNQQGFDTGIAISNTSDDTGVFPGDGGAAPQSGPCTIHYFGNVTGGGAEPPPMSTTSPIAAGEQLTFVLSSGGTNGMTGTPGFQGYIIAACDFQYGHGFAFITDGPIGQARVAEGYLGLVLDGSIGPRSTDFESETLDN